MCEGAKGSSIQELLVSRNLILPKVAHKSKCEQKRVESKFEKTSFLILRMMFLLDNSCQNLRYCPGIHYFLRTFHQKRQ